MPIVNVCRILALTSMVLLQGSDLRETTRLAIEGYNSSVSSLTFQESVFATSGINQAAVSSNNEAAIDSGQVTFYAEDARGRRAVDMKVYGSGNLVFRDAAYHDGKQGYEVRYSDSDPQRMIDVTIDHHWAGDSGRIGLPHALSLTRWSAPQQGWKPYSLLLVREATKVYKDRLEVDDTAPRTKTILYPDPHHAYVPSRIKVEFENGSTQDTQVDEFTFVAGRWFPLRGTVKVTGKLPENNYSLGWRVAELKINEPVSDEIFRPNLSQSGLHVRNNITGETYTTDGTRIPAAAEIPGEGQAEIPDTGIRASPQLWPAWRIAAYGLGTLSLSVLLLAILHRVRCMRISNAGD